MKALKFLTVTGLFLLILPLGNAHAAFFQNFAELYTVSAPGNTVQDSTFTLSQQPWLYSEAFSTTPSNDTGGFFNVFVKSPTGQVYHSTELPDNNQDWETYSSSFWNSIKTPGDWTVKVVGIEDGQHFFGKTSFVVNAAPEPVPTVLFLTGALLMSIYALRRKRVLARA